MASMLHLGSSAANPRQHGCQEFLQLLQVLGSNNANAIDWLVADLPSWQPVDGLAVVYMVEDIDETASGRDGSDSEGTWCISSAKHMGAKRGRARGAKGKAKRKGKGAAATSTTVAGPAAATAQAGRAGLDGGFTAVRAGEGMVPVHTQLARGLSPPSLRARIEGPSFTPQLLKPLATSDPAPPPTAVPWQASVTWTSSAGSSQPAQPPFVASQQPVMAAKPHRPVPPPRARSECTLVGASCTCSTVTMSCTFASEQAGLGTPGVSPAAPVPTSCSSDTCCNATATTAAAATTAVAAGHAGNELDASGATSKVHGSSPTGPGNYMLAEAARQLDLPQWSAHLSLVCLSLASPLATAAACSADFQPSNPITAAAAKPWRSTADSSGAAGNPAATPAPTVPNPSAGVNACRFMDLLPPALQVQAAVPTAYLADGNDSYPPSSSIPPAGVRLPSAQNQCAFWQLASPASEHSLLSFSKDGLSSASSSTSLGSLSGQARANPPTSQGRPSAGGGATRQHIQPHPPSSGRVRTSRAQVRAQAGSRCSSSQDQAAVGAMASGLARGLAHLNARDPGEVGRSGGPSQHRLSVGAASACGSGGVISSRGSGGVGSAGSQRLPVITPDLEVCSGKADGR